MRYGLSMLLEERVDELKISFTFDHGGNFDHRGIKIAYPPYEVLELHLWGSMCKDMC